MSGRMSYYAGAAAEDLVARDYHHRGNRVLARRWRGRGGEIDLVLQRGEQVVFVEVKRSRSHDRAAARVSRRQMQRIMSAATEFVADQPNGQLTDMQFDVATVDATGTVQILENAFI